MLKVLVSPFLLIGILAFGSKLAVAGGPMITDILKAANIETSHTRTQELSVPIRWPLCAGIYSGFGYRVDVLTGRVVFHTGIDLRGDFGTRVQASASGTVILAERRGPYGLMLEIDHGSDERTRYSQLQATLVQVGDHVERGQTIAEVGSSGRSAGPNLHFEIIIRDKIVDPVPYLPSSDECAVKLHESSDCTLLSVCREVPDLSLRIPYTRN